MNTNFIPKQACLKQQNILITGASNGIGRALALALSEFAANLILLDKDVKGLESLYDEIAAKNYPKPSLYPLDLSGAHEKHYQELADVITKEYKTLHGIIHNAAFLGQITPFEHYNIELWYKVMQTNFNGPMMLTQKCLPLLLQAEKANLIFTSDSVGRKSKAYWGAYACSKFATEGLMQTLADEYETHDGLSICSIDPGIINTHLRTQAYPGEDPNDRIQATEIVNQYIEILLSKKNSVHGLAITF